MIFYGYFLYPEASKILKFYISDHNGEHLYLKSKYFFNSALIIDLISQNKHGIIGPIRINISDNKRIAYTINGFYFNIDNNEIYQNIDFVQKTDMTTYTYFDLPKGRLKIPDRLIRVFENENGCKPFTVHILP